MPREAFRHFFKEGIGEWTGKITWLADRFRADLAEGGVGIALNDIELRDGAVGIDKEADDDPIDFHFMDTLLNF